MGLCDGGGVRSPGGGGAGQTLLPGDGRDGKTNTAAGIMEGGTRFAPSSAGRIFSALLGRRGLEFRLAGVPPLLEVFFSPPARPGIEARWSGQGTTYDRSPDTRPGWRSRRRGRSGRAGQKRFRAAGSAGPSGGRALRMGARGGRGAWWCRAPTFQLNAPRWWLTDAAVAADPSNENGTK